MDHKMGVFVLLIMSTIQIVSGISQDVFFSAFTNRHFTNEDLKQQIIIKFQDVETNTGHAYNANTGLFTAPYDGAYRFDWSFLIAENGQLWLCLFINQGCVIKSVGKAEGNGNYSGVSRSVIVRLRAGDTVSIRYHFGLVSMYGLEGRYTSFSGQYLG